MSQMENIVKDSIDTAWFVGATYGDDDQLDNFIEQGIWKNGYSDRYLDQVRSMQKGEKIVIKSAFTRKYELPFDNRGHMVSVMAIKAIGTITNNLNDGQTVQVDWLEKFDDPKQWYFYTNRTTVWRIDNTSWMNKALLDFTFKGTQQDYGKFANAPCWKERFGDTPKNDVRFKWTNFYESFADKLLSHKSDRKALTAFIIELANKYQLSYIIGKDLDDVCPFTVMGIFNRGVTEQNRKALASALAQFLSVDEPIPESFEAIPILNNQKSWFFAYEESRGKQDIDNLWSIFESALTYADSQNEDSQNAFAALYNQVSSQLGVGWNLTMGLFWIRPWAYPTLDTQSRDYLTLLGVNLNKTGVKGRCSAKDYLTLMNNLEIRFSEEKFPVHSYPELSLKAWQQPSKKSSEETKFSDKRDGWKSLILERIEVLCRSNESAVFTREQFHSEYLEELSSLFPDNKTPDMTIDRQMQILRDESIIGFLQQGQYEWYGYEDIVEDLSSINESTEYLEPYNVTNIINDGCFLSEETVTHLLQRLRDKKNLILQGPPGTGKTWLAKRLAYALINEKKESNLCAVQFHPNLSYEDFVRGWRPSGDGKLTLCDGPFLEAVELARGNPDQRYVVVIEEINRGNPAQIFGEMLTLLEADKRTPTEGLSLSYKKNNNERVYIPENLYVIGTMNIADRSLALVDLALRRRFAFFTLETTLDDTWMNWVSTTNQIPVPFLIMVKQKIDHLNSLIETDQRLGKQFKVGHSYVTPSFSSEISDPISWFSDVVNTEIYPLLEEYWFDSIETADSARLALLEGLQ